MARVPVVQQGGWRDSMSRFGYQLRKSPLTMLGLGIIVVVIVAVACANFLAPYDPNMISLAHRLAPPSARHWLGTDEVDRKSTRLNSSHYCASRMPSFAFKKKINQQQ